ncbi:MAG TPA: SRPBCC domain-containing protein, partial [Agrococcus sp.]|nr:SRPBCC domain-containing protein [Agrococcus sp.]
MTSTTGSSDRILGSLRSEDGRGAVRIEDRFDTGIDDLWSALTDPARLVRWLGEVDGDLRPAGEFRARFFASGWDGAGRIEACEPPRRILLQTWEEGERPHDLEVTLRAEGERTLLVVEERGMPLDQVGAYGAGTQVHV